jgi:nucleotide-binding universal stress UspA family protein
MSMKKLMLAIDGSPQSLRAAEYAAEVAPYLPDVGIVLFSVVSGLPPDAEIALDASPPPEHELHGYEDKRDELQSLHAQVVRITELFAGKGLAGDDLEVCCRPMRHGVAEDILEEARARGCDTVAVGSRHLSKVMSLLQGSVSANLVHKADALTLWVVG